MKILILTVLISACSAIFAQQETAKIWSRTYNSGIKELSRMTKTDNSGNVFIAGFKSNSGNWEDPTARIILLKYSPEGSLLWSKTFQSRSGGRTAPYSMAVDDSGNAYICGVADTLNNILYSRALVVKFKGNGDTVWSRYNGISLYQWAYKDIKVDHSGTVYLSYELHVSSGPSPGWASYCVKYNTAGVLLWSSTQNINVADAKVDIDGSGNAYLAGTRYSPVPYDIFVTQIDQNGTPQWSTVYNNPNNSNDVVTALKVEPTTGDVFVTGWSGVMGPEQIETIKLSAGLGQLQWAKRTSGTFSGGFNTTSAIELGSNNDLYVCGTFTNNSTGRDAFLIKYNTSNGNETFRKIYSSGNNNTAETGCSVAVDPAGNVIFAGTRSAYHDVFFQKFSSAGSLVSSCLFNDSLNVSENIPVSVVFGSGNKMYITSNDTMQNNSSSDITITAFDVIGVNTSTICRSINLPIPDNQSVYDTIQVNTGTDNLVRLELRIDSLVHTNAKDLIISLISPNGVTRQLSVNSGLNIPSTGMIHTVFSDSALMPIDSGSVTYTGYFAPKEFLGIHNSFSPDGAWILKITDTFGGNTGTLYKWCLNVTYQTPIGIQNVSGEVPETFILSQNYPNPFNPVTNIRFSVPAASNVKITVYDITGREAAVLVNEFKTRGNYNVDFNAAGLSSGVYFYRLETKDFTDVKKMVLVK